MWLNRVSVKTGLPQVLQSNISILVQTLAVQASVNSRGQTTNLGCVGLQGESTNVVYP